MNNDSQLVKRFSQIFAKVFVYGKLRFCQRGISNGNSKVGKQATTFREAKNSNFLYTMLAIVFIIYLIKYSLMFKNPRY